MDHPLLDLRRLWRDTHLAFSSDARGYMGVFSDRDDLNSLAQFGFHSTESLAEHECLFLLGRPGAGKSAEIERIKRGDIAAFREEWIVLIRCKEAGLDLYPEIIRDPRWIAGLQQPKPVRLVLDGLDEGFLREPAYFLRLKRTLEILRAEHRTLRLLLTCRPAEWDVAFGAAVTEMWQGRGTPAVFALEPLSDNQQRLLVEHWDIQNTTGFFCWVFRNRFNEFAAWPRSLEWLSDQFCVGRGENLTYTELCQLRVARSFGEDKRLSEARRAARAEAWSHAIMLIAATLVFCGRKGISLDRLEADCLALDELFCAANRLEIPNRPPLAREDVREAVQTSHLIEAQGNYHRFENQSDLEFLAGAMLASMDAEQLEELLGSPDHGKRWRVFPQLATTAANIAAQSPHFFDYLLAQDPRVLMRADFASKSFDDRRATVDAILKATATIGATGGHDEHGHFSTLSHPGIAAQLRPWIFDKKQSPIVRELAFDIARECCGADLWLEFESAAAGDEFVARWLPSVVQRFGKIWSEDRLQHWALNANDGLAGAALDALLDRGLKLRDIATLLHEPRSDVFGGYQLHLVRLARECTAEDVPAALAVIGQWPSVAITHGPIRELVLALVSKGVSALARQDIQKALTRFLISRLADHDRLLENSVSQCGLDDSENRKALFLALVEDWPTSSQEELSPFDYPLQREDHAWLLNEVATAKGPAALVLGKFTANLVWRFDEELREPLERAYAESPEFRANLPMADGAGIYVTLQRLREESQARHLSRLEESQSKRKRPIFSHEKQLADALTRCRAGKFGAWTDVCFALSQPSSERDGTEFFRHTDPRQLAGWIAASEELCVEMIEFGRQFLLHEDVPTPEAKSIPGSFFGLAYALSLHAGRLNEDHDLRAAIRPIWPLALLRHCGSEDGPLAAPLQALTAVAPSVVAEACHREFSERWERNESIFGQLLPAAWCTETEQALAEVLTRAPLQPETYMSGLTMLAGYNAELADQLATQRLAEHVEQSEDSAARRAAIAACLFVRHDLWERAWPHFLADRVAARLLLLEYARWLGYHEGEQRITELPDDLIAALYGLMIELFPIKDAPQHEGGYTPTALDDAYGLRGQLQRALEARGAHAKLSAIYQRCDETKAEWWPKPSIDRAEGIAHASRRQPPIAKEFIRYLATQGGTFVSDNDSLQRAVRASLQRFERTLSPNGLIAVWDKGQPRNEEALQVAIADHLRREFMDRRIVVNMETKILHERSDIRVEAGEYVITLEVKLGHSSDRDRPLRTAMRSQLRAYLENQNETHGIYVVGWFFCPAYRPGALIDMKSLVSARRYFAAQAKKLTSSRFTLAAAVLDCRWPEATSSRTGKQRTARSR